MSQLIRLLAVKAGMIVDEPNGFDKTQLSQSEKRFAELIIKECINYINDRTEDWDAELLWIFNDESGYMKVNIDSLLKEHFFGVKE